MNEESTDDPPSWKAKFLIALLIALIFFLICCGGIESHAIQQNFRSTTKRKNQTHQLLDQETIRAIRPIEPEYRGSSGKAELERYIRATVSPNLVNWMLDMASCESSFNPLAESKAGAKGLLQFMPSTFRNYGGQDILDWREQLRIAEGMVNRDWGNRSQWECSSIMGY